MLQRDDALVGIKNIQLLSGYSCQAVRKIAKIYLRNVEIWSWMVL